MKVVEKEKDDLEGAKNEAEEFLAMKKNKAKEEYTLYQRRMLVVYSVCMLVFYALLLIAAMTVAS